MSSFVTNTDVLCSCRSRFPALPSSTTLSSSVLVSLSKQLQAPGSQPWTPPSRRGQRARGRAQGAMPPLSSSVNVATLKCFSSLLAGSCKKAASAGGAGGGVLRCWPSRFALHRAAPFTTSALVGRAYYPEGGSTSPEWGRVSPSSSSVVAAGVQGTYEPYGLQQQGELPRPPVIQWEKDLTNAVQLIGNIGRDIDIKYLDSGMSVATTSLAVKKGKNDETSWFELEMWDALAAIAAQHIKKGEQIFVTGRIVVNKWVKENVRYSIAKVIVRDLCFVEAYSGPRQSYGQASFSQPQDDYVDMVVKNRPQELMNVGSPQRNWNQPLQDDTPVQGTPLRKESSKGYDEAAATEKKWQEYFADPTQWWDNRRDKKNPKSPDFKHKSTQEALWVDSWNNPPWVLQQMAVLEEQQARHTESFVDSRKHNQQKKLSSFRDSDFMY